MTTILVVFAVAGFISLIAAKFLILVGNKAGMLDCPDQFRKKHAHPIPRLGGLALYIAFFLPLVALVHFSSLTLVSRQVLWNAKMLGSLFCCSSLALALGAADDIFDLGPRWKFMWQVMIAAVTYHMGFRIEMVSNPFGDPLVFGIFSFPVTVLWFVACMNAINLLDGIDGLAAGISMFVGFVLFLASMQFENVFGMLLMACLTGSIMGFLFFNFPPAKIFLGDSGSLFLGFLLAALSIVGAHHKADMAIALFIPTVALGIPLLDTSLAIVRRWYHKMPLSSGDRGHMHHVLVAMGLSPTRAVLVLYALAVILALFAVLITIGRNELVFLVVAGVVAIAYISLRVFARLTIRDVIKRVYIGRLEREETDRTKIVLARYMSFIEETSTLVDLWAGSSGFFDELDLARVELSIDLPGGEDRWSREWVNKHVVDEDVVGSGWAIWVDLVCGPEISGQIRLERHGKEPFLPKAEESWKRLRMVMSRRIEFILNQGRKMQ